MEPPEEPEYPTDRVTRLLRARRAAEEQLAMTRPRYLIAALAAAATVMLAAACGSSPAPPASGPGSTSTASSQDSSSQDSSSPSASPTHHRARHLAGLLAVHDPGEVTGTITGSCRTRRHGRLPDSRCTPGSVDPAVTQANIGSTICRSGYTATVRPPSSQTSSFKYSVAEPAYGQSGSGELDHLVPLELGGSNDATNLWVETGSIPNPKDAVENALNNEVCDGTLSLRAAQREIARNWLTVAAALGLATGSAPASAPTSAAPAGGCHPTTSSGNCYEPGEFCPHADAGQTGVAGDGKTITCEQSGGSYRWVS
jgi:hypothetical protein